MGWLLAVAISALWVGSGPQEPVQKPAWLIIGTASREGRIQHVTAARFASLAECTKELSQIVVVPEAGEAQTILPSCTDRRPTWWLE